MGLCLALPSLLISHLSVSLGVGRGLRVWGSSGADVWEDHLPLVVILPLWHTHRQFPERVLFARLLGYIHKHVFRIPLGKLLQIKKKKRLKASENPKASQDLRWVSLWTMFTPHRHSVFSQTGLQSHLFASAVNTLNINSFLLRSCMFRLVNNQLLSEQEMAFPG